MVSSPAELRGLRAALGPRALLVAPGIRARGDVAADQVRTASAREAIAGITAWAMTSSSGRTSMP